jgi:small subunit ribosomal protein S4|tara:strand:+ start:1859 stop:2413 length:555 start_codon:yes stop_codon:yes gene_type:complete
MGLARHQRKKYTSPNHPWQADRIAEEKSIIKEYGFTNKKQIWKMQSVLRNYRAQAREIVGLRGERKDIALKTLIEKLIKLGLVDKDATADNVLNLQLRDLLERRLQTVVYKMGLSNSVNQSRQFILHRKVTVNGRVVTSPAYLVNVGDRVAFKEGFSPVLVAVVEKEAKTEEKVEVKLQEVKTE